MNEQYLRKCSLVLENGSRSIDLSEMRITFHVDQSDFQTPNNATIRVYNLKEETARLVEKEFTRVVLEAGYQGGTQYGTIFAGEVKQTRRGREMGGTGSVDTYLDIRAAENDVALLSAFLEETVEGGTTRPAAQMDAIIAAMQKQINPLIVKGFVMDLPPTVLSRGKVKWGTIRDQILSIERTYNARFSMQGNEVNLVPLDGYIPTDIQPAVVLNAATGLIGRPEVTLEGIKVRCLLNPNIVCGGLIQINNKSVENLLLNGEVLKWPGRIDAKGDDGLPLYPGLKPVIPDGDGFYKVLVAEYSGDTRGKNWYSELICLGLTAEPPGGKVAAHA